MTWQSKAVVVTGSTRGIGHGLVREFLKRGHSVMVSGRSQASVDAAVTELQRHATGDAKITGQTCDITDLAQVQALWEAAAKAFDRVDIWINNAGAINVMRPIGELRPMDMTGVPMTNLVGMMNGCRVALNGMTAQGQGALYTFEGFGSDGAKSDGMSVYGASKFGLRYFTQSLIKETKGGPVLVGSMSPGMVTTDMLLGAKNEVSPERWKKMQFIYRILAEDVETVTPFLVEGVLANTKHGATIAWLTRSKALMIFLKHFLIKKRSIPKGLEDAA
jgi:NAD(P)-dependent dehydrogenase (short-subunit alcohol dehydrogenase family)